MGPGPQTTAATLLLVDDDPDTLQMLGGFLRGHGYRVLAEGNPLKALALAGSEQVDLLITDWRLPHVDGITLTEQVHRLPGREQLPVILITGHEDDEVVDQSLRRGVALTLPKPLELSRLLDLVGFATAPPPPPDH